MSRFRFKMLGVVVALAALTGCVGTDIENARNMQPTGGTPFTRALAEEYRSFALFEADEMYDWADAGYFARKALAAGQGEVVEPELLENWNLPADKVDELANARLRLVGLLNQSARDKVPNESAIAQAKFDCWVEQQEENHQPDDIAACRDEFYAALAQMEAAFAPVAVVPDEFIVYFAFDSDVVSDQGKQIIQRSLAGAREGGLTEFAVTGHTDTSGSAEYNLGLSIRRANAIKAVMVGMGVPAADVSVAGRGESELAVPTPDGVREQANRRAVIVAQ